MELEEMFHSMLLTSQVDASILELNVTGTVTNSSLRTGIFRKSTFNPAKRSTIMVRCMRASSSVVG
jgi:hypothetical protein